MILFKSKNNFTHFFYQNDQCTTSWTLAVPTYICGTFYIHAVVGTQQLMYLVVGMSFFTHCPFIQVGISKQTQRVGTLHTAPILHNIFQATPLDFTSHISNVFHCRFLKKIFHSFTETHEENSVPKISRTPLTINNNKLTRKILYLIAIRFSDLGFSYRPLMNVFIGRFLTFFVPQHFSQTYLEFFCLRHACYFSYFYLLPDSGGIPRNNNC